MWFPGTFWDALHDSARIRVAHSVVMWVEARAVRQSVSLPAKIYSKVCPLAKARRLRETRMLVELLENGIEAEQRKQQ